MSKTLGATVGIPPRNVKIDFNENAIHSYYNNNFFLTTFWNGLGSLFPEGEQFFVDSVKNYRSQITNEKLLAEISGFIGQESMHSREHNKLNTLLNENGYDIKPLEKQLAFALNVGRKLPKKWQLAITVCLEHFTAIMGKQLLEKSYHNGMITDESFKRLWLWHAGEEVNHAPVAFDVYKAVGGSAKMRNAIMIPTSIILFIVLVYVVAFMLHKKKQLFKLDNIFGIIFLFNLFKPLKNEFIDFFKADFHPSDHFTPALTEKVKQHYLDINVPY